MVEIKQVKTRADYKEFIKVPFPIYEDNKYWIPPMLSDEMNTLRKDKNPAFDYCEADYWIAYKDGKPVGRIAGIINKTYNEINNAKRARFGWVDFIDDEEVSAALFSTVEKWAREKGMDKLNGPLGFCDADHQGMLIEGFEELGMIITIYNHPYYPVHLEKLGYMKDIDWIEIELKVPDEIPEKIIKINDLILKRTKMKVINFKTPKEILPYAKEIFELYNEAYKNLFGFTYLTDRQIEAYIKQYFTFVNPDYVKVIVDADNKIAAFGIAMPSLALALQKTKGRLFPFGFITLLKAIKKNDRLDLYLVAARPELQGKGLTALLLTEVNKAALKNGIKFAETGPELETNDKVLSMWKYYEGRQHKRRRCFIKEL